jgi:hypothetical protein
MTEDSICPVCLGVKSFERYPDELHGLLPTVDYKFTPATRLTYGIVECSDCGHQYVSPAPQVEILYTDNEDETYLAAQQQREKSAEAWLRIVTSVAPPSDARTLLDIGCATGIFLDTASRFYVVCGVELSEWASKIASRHHEVWRKPVSQQPTTRRFDVVTMWGVIEHLSNPRDEINAISELTNVDGLLFIYTGDRAAFLPRLLKKKWWWYQGMHIQYFSKSGLRQLLETSGFEVVGTRNLPIFFSLRSLAQSMNRYALLKPFVWILSKRPFSRLTIRLTLSGEMLMIARKVGQ